MTKIKNPISLAVAGLDDNVKRIRETQKLLRDHRSQVTALIRRAQTKKLAPLNLSIWVSSGRDYNEDLKVNETIITVGISAYNLSGLKDKRFVDLLGRFMDADRESTRDSAAYLNRDYFFWFRLPEPDTWIKVAVYAYVREGSPTCRKVLRRTDTELVEKPVYEIVCD